MMYIEHTNLEDNLHQILTNRVPTSSSPSASEATAAVAASALLARVREAQNSASTTLHQLTQTPQQQELQTISSPSIHFQNNHHSSNNSSTPNNYKSPSASSNKEWIKRPEPNLLPLEDHNNSSTIIKNLNNLNSNLKAATEQQQVLQEEQQKQHQQLNNSKVQAVDEEEEEEEEYELLQVIDSDPTITQAENSTATASAAELTTTPLKFEENLKQQPEYFDNFASTSHFVINLNDGQKIDSTLAATKEQQEQSLPIQVDEDEEFEYVITRVPKRKRQSEPIYTDIPVFNRKVRRPVPEAIPIETHLRARSCNGQPIVFAAPPPPPPPPLIPHPQLRRSIPNLHKFSTESEEYYYNTHRNNLLNGYDDTPRTANNVYFEDDNNVGYYSDLETVEAASTGRPVYAYNNDSYSRQEAQMGLHSLLNKFTHFFNWNPSTNHYSTVQREGKRKRRSDELYAGDTSGPQQIKYRKVENRFPKYIATREEDDVSEFLPPPSPQTQNISHKYDKEYLLNNSAQRLLEMSNRRSSASLDKPPLRKSMFSAPHITQQFIKNTTYADVEFSDDDEPILLKGFDIKPTPLTSIKRGPEVHNIPIIRTEERLRSSQQRSTGPPGLIEPNTGSILQSSLIPDIENRRKPTYAETLRQSVGTGHILGGRSSISSSVASTSESSRILNGLIGLRSNNCWSTQNRASILNQEKESEEREKYQQLLEQVVPRIYGGENKFSSSSSASNSAAQRRRSGLLLGTALTSSARSSPAANRRSMGLGQSILKRPPLSSTINLDDDDDDDVTITGISHLKTSRSEKSKQSMAPKATVIVDDDEISDIVDLGNEERHVLSACAKIQKEENSIINLCEDKVEKPKKDALPYVEPVNSLKERFNACPIIKESWVENWQSKWLQIKKSRSDEVKETLKVTEKLTAERRAAEAEIQERLRKFQIVDPELLVVDDFEDVIEEPEFVELTQEHRARINAAICGPLDQVLVSKFNLNITRRDIHTLCGHNWLNDEVINFYMNLLTERGEKKRESHGLPTVYAMNTFFVPRLLQAGHSGVKRWTRKVDIFAKDIMPVPVHVGGVHWCMAIIHMKERSIKYYDSMGTPNPSVLKALEQYLKDESMDKRKQPFDTSGFVIESVQGVPRQMNGSDCGVFSCMFAEYITRNREITFSQQNMEYFRQKMILEIVMGELLQ
ncbi:ulp1 [Cochliomyia hominivorax]